MKRWVSSLLTTKNGVLWREGYSFPVDKKTYESSIEFLKSCFDTACVADKDKLRAFKWLARL